MIARAQAGRLVTRIPTHRERVTSHAAVLLAGQVMSRCGLIRPVGIPSQVWVRSELVPVSCRSCQVAQ